MVSLPIRFLERRRFRTSIQRWRNQLHERASGVWQDRSQHVGISGLGGSRSGKRRNPEAGRRGHHVWWYGELSPYVSLLFGVFLQARAAREIRVVLEAGAR